jgi:hypothetical protein
MLAPLIPTVLPPEGLPIPVDEIRSRFRLMGFLPGNSGNSISPRLVLHPTQLEVKVINTSFHSYHDLRQVDYSAGWFLSRAQVILKFNDGTDYFIKVSYDLSNRRLLEFFHVQGIPLSVAAQQALAS